MKKETFYNSGRVIITLIMLTILISNMLLSEFIAAAGWCVALLLYMKIITGNYLRYLENTNKEAVENAKPILREINELKKTISAADVMKYARDNDGRSFMCKNCGSKHYALQTTRHYCEKCGCWLCPDCSGELCEECRTN